MGVKWRHNRAKKSKDTSIAPPYLCNLFLFPRLQQRDPLRRKEPANAMSCPRQGTGQDDGGGPVRRHSGQGQGFFQGEERGWRWQRGGGKKKPGDQFHGSLPEEALVMLKQRVTLLLNRV